MNEIEKEVYKDLEKAQTVNDVFTAIEKLQGEPETVVGHTLTATAGSLISEGIRNEHMGRKMRDVNNLK